MNEDDDQLTLEAEADENGAEETSVRQDVSQIAADLRQFFYAELQYYQARLNYSKSVAKWTGLYLAIALCAVFGTVMALILGVLLTVSELTGPLVATIVVSLVSLLIAISFALLARRTGKKFKFPELDDKDE